MNYLLITVISGISSDGFSVNVLTSEGESLFSKEYRYGSTVSHSEWSANKNKPYAKTLIDDLCVQYKVSKVEVVAGKNVFTGELVSDESVDHFKEKYLA